MDKKTKEILEKHLNYAFKPKSFYDMENDKHRTQPNETEKKIFIDSVLDYFKNLDFTVRVKRGK